MLALLAMALVASAGISAYFLNQLEAYGLRVTEQVPIEITPNGENLRYLRTKREKLGHRLHHQDLKFEPDE